jgi:hypothetical protein
MHIHSLKRAATAACVLAAVAAAPASAATVTTQLRVETYGNELAPGWSYAHDSVSYTTSKACSGTGSEKTITGPSALGLLFQASDYHAALRPVRITDQFEFADLVCGVGEYESSDSRFWLYKVDHVAPEVGAGQFPIERSHDQVLWYLVDSAAGVNTGNELGLFVNDRDVQAGEPVRVRVVEYGFDGTSSPAVGVLVQGNEGAVTDGSGFATLVFDEPGRPVIRGVRGGDIPTDGVRLCVWEDSASECAGAMHDRIVGTDGPDTLRGTRGRERFVARGGADRINTRDGARDIVHCGKGLDTLRADTLDRTRGGCERVIRK